MILVQRYIFKELLYNFAFTFVVVTLIMLLAMAVKVVFDIQVFGVLMLIKCLPLMLTASLKMIVPSAALVATVMTYGRVASDNEIVTMRASGIHVLRIIVPGVLFGLLVSFMLLIINDRLIPNAERKLKTMQNEIDIEALIDAILRRGEKKLDYGDWLLTWSSSEAVTVVHGVGEIQKKTDAWKFVNLRVKQYDKDKKDKVLLEIISESGILTTDETGDCLVVNFNKPKSLIGSAAEAEDASITLPFKKVRKSKVRLSMRKMSALCAIVDRKEEQKVYPDHKVETELHKRIADSFGPLVFVFLSLPVAILFRQQNRMVAFLIAILLAIFIYYPITLLGEKWSKGGDVSPYLSIWPGNIGLALIGFVLILKVMKR